MPGAGKSTLGKLVASHLGVPFLDLDDAISTVVHEPVATYLRRVGEDAFRDTEHDVLTTALARSGVLATGAGVVTRDDNREALRQHGRVVFLDVPRDVLFAHVASGDRPLLGENPRAALDRLWAQREAWYREVANATISYDPNIEVMVERLREVVRTWSS